MADRRVHELARALYAGRIDRRGFVRGMAALGRVRDGNQPVPEGRGGPTGRDGHSGTRRAEAAGRGAAV